MKEELLKPCPFCDGKAYFERLGNHHQSCVVICEECGATLESSEEGECCGNLWNSRAQFR